MVADDDDGGYTEVDLTSTSPFGTAVIKVQGRDVSADEDTRPIIEIDPDANGTTKIRGAYIHITAGDTVQLNTQNWLMDGLAEATTDKVLYWD